MTDEQRNFNKDKSSTDDIKISLTELTDKENVESSKTVWDYFIKTTDNRDYAKCLYRGCNSLIKIKGSCTIGLHRHLNAIHKIYPVKNEKRHEANIEKKKKGNKIIKYTEKKGL